jgi:hypothetical protein
MQAFGLFFDKNIIYWEEGRKGRREMKIARADARAIGLSAEKSGW